MSHAERGIELLTQGKSPQEVLALVLAGDEGKDLAQAAIVGPQGSAVAYTRSRGIAQAGHRTGRFYFVQANMMGKATVWPAIEQAYLVTTSFFPPCFSRGQRV